MKRQTFIVIVLLDSMFACADIPKHSATYYEAIKPEVQEEGPNGETYYSYPKYTPEEAFVIANTNLMARPFFKDFRNEQIYGEGGSSFLQANDLVRWYALSHGIPAESFAAGANPVPKWGATVHGNPLKQKRPSKGVFGNVNMATNCIPDGADVKEMPWVHSYFIRNSLFDTRVLFEALVEIIGTTRSVNSQEGSEDE